MASSAEVVIGKHYKIKLQLQHLMRSVKRASELLTKSYPYYVDVNGKEVVALEKEHDTNIRVGLVEKGPLQDDYWLTISSRWLVPIGDKCTCSTKILMCRGCLCGVFRQEQSNLDQKVDDEQTPLPSP